MENIEKNNPTDEHINMDYVKQTCQELYGEKDEWPTEFEANIITVLEAYKKTGNTPDNEQDKKIIEKYLTLEK